MNTPLTLEQALARIQVLEAANKAKASGNIKVSKAGAVSVYGLGRFPVTLYKSQWDALIQRIPDIQAFIEAHASELATKTDANVSQDHEA
jgi:hypothetical protein